MKRICCKKISTLFCVAIVLLNFGFSQSNAKNNVEDWSKKPAIVVPANRSGAPSDAIILFDGHGLSHWEGIGGKKNADWKTEGDYFTVEPGQGDIVTKQSFGDCQLHVEWKIPAYEVQNHLNWGNSGVYLMGLYEVQIYSSFNNEHKIYYNGQAGSIYKQHKPLVNACIAPGVWQWFDIVFTAPRFNLDGSLASPAYFTVFQNGILIQNHVALSGPTTHTDYTEYKAHAPKLPILLQEHGSRVSYRNIWVREL